MKGVLFIELLDFSAKSVASFLTAIISPVNKKKEKEEKRKERRLVRVTPYETLLILTRLLIDCTFQFFTF